MKKRWLVLISCIWAVAAFANDCTNTATLEARASYFRPFSKTFRELFRNGGIDYSLETTIPVWCGLNVWGAVDYFSRGGKMIGIDRSTRLTMVPITAGLKYVYFCNRYYGVYAGAGTRYYFVELINRVYPIHRVTHRQGFGGIVEVGNLFCLNNSFLIDLFASCSFKSFHGLRHLPPNAESSRIDVGGWNVGGGLGYKF